MKPLKLPVARVVVSDAPPERRALGPARPLSLRANFAWTLVGNVVYAGCQWAMLVVLAKLGTPQLVGQFALALAITAPVLMFTNLQLRQVQATDARAQYPFGDYLALRLLTTGLALFAIAGLVGLAGYAPATAGVIVIVGLAKAFEAVSDIFYGLFQQREQMDRIAISMILKGGLSLAALGMLLYLTGSLWWGVVGLAGIWAAVLVFYDIPSGAHLLRQAGMRAAAGRPRWDPATLARLTWLALPLGVVMLLVSLNTNIPRYFIEHYRGDHELGIFAAMAYLVVAETTVLTALGQSATPRLAQYYADGNHRAFYRLVGRLLVICLGLGAGGVLVAAFGGRPLLAAVYTPEYATYSDVFVWIMLAAALLNVASVFGYAATARQRFRYQPLAWVAIVLASLITGYALIHTNGLWGASLSMGAASLVALIAYFLLWL
jgi:O-antigen/teichoic acid export membrane protein